MKQYPDFWHTLIGPGPLGVFMAFMVIGMFCAAISLWIESANRDLSSNNTPVKWSWKFFFTANMKRIVGNIMLIPVMIRITYTHLPLEVMVGASAGIGLLFDRIFMYLKNKYGSLFGSPEAAAKVADKIAPDDVQVTPKQ